MARVTQSGVSAVRPIGIAVKGEEEENGQCRRRDNDPCCQACWSSKGEGGKEQMLRKGGEPA